MHVSWRVVVIVGVCAAGALLASAAASADPDCDEIDDDCAEARIVDNRAVEARAFDWSSVNTGEATSSTSASPACSYQSLTSSDLADYFDQAVRATIPTGARLYRVTCDDGMSWRYGWWVPGGSASAYGAYHDVVQEAVDRLAPPRPRMLLTPPHDARHIVGIPTWLAVDRDAWSTHRMTVSAGDVHVEVLLDPLVVNWTLGDGVERSCTGPGPVFDPARAHDAQTSDCTHTWLVAPSVAAGHPELVTYSVTARILYEASYILDVDGASASGDLGRVAGPVVRHEVVVRDVQAVRIAR